MEQNVHSIPKETLTSMGIFLYTILKKKIQSGEVKIEEGKIIKK
jgi:hypothetical protein